MKWIELLRKDDYALLQSETDTQYCVASGYDPTQPEDKQWRSGTYFTYWNGTKWKILEVERKKTMSIEDKNILKSTEMIMMNEHFGKYLDRLELITTWLKIHSDVGALSMKAV